MLSVSSMNERSIRSASHEGRRHRRRWSVAAITACIVVAACSAAWATRADLTGFLERAQKMSAHNKAVRADIELTLPDGSTEEAVLMVVPEKNRSFIAFRSSGWRALMPLDWDKGKVVRKKGGKPEAYGVDEPLAGTDIRGIEFFPFWGSDYSTAFISDSTKNEKTITLYAPDEIPYILFVITFDKTTLVPVTTKYYRDQMSNLVRLREDTDYRMVGSRPRPGKIVITDYTENSTTKAKLTWRTLDAVPDELFGDATFYKADVEWGADRVARR